MRTRSTRRPARLFFRIAAGAAVGLAGVLLTATAASAHIHVDGTDTTRGGEGVLTFRVPSESDTASTVGVQITFPTDTPITDASTQPKPGWTATITTAKASTPIQTDDGPVDTYVTQVTWKADSAAAGIAPGEFDTFAVAVGPLPAVASVSFPALQTYSDGSQVNWNEQATGGVEPEHPAPTLTISPSTDSASASASPSATADASTMDMSSSNSAPAWPGIVGLIAGGVALVIAIVAIARTSRKETPSA
jgi:periplasmic copper chaperone A